MTKGFRTSMPTTPAARAYVNAIGTATPPHDIHQAFVTFAAASLEDDRRRALFTRMAARSGIAHRYSSFCPAPEGSEAIDTSGFYPRGRFPGTGVRMEVYAREAVGLAHKAVLALDADLPGISHLIVVSCTGFVAPGLDLQLAALLGLRADVARMVIGFMGCAAAVPALRAADAIVRADPAARVLVVNVELCSLHLQDCNAVETALSMLLFGDGATAALVTAEPNGIALEAFRAVVVPDSADLITWTIGDHGFQMFLSGQVPGRIQATLQAETQSNHDNGLLRGRSPDEIALWAVHGGGRTVLEAVACGLSLPEDALAVSRSVLHDFGNMSSCTIMFVLARMLAVGRRGPGLAMAFGPGMVAETFAFQL